MDYKIAHITPIQDQRGELIVFLHAGELAPTHTAFGQIYFVTFSQEDAVRGNHYHKKFREWFGVVSGCCTVILEDITTKERKTLVLDAKEDRYTRLEIGPNVAHTFQSKSPNTVLLNYIDQQWKPGDTFPYKLI
jgi:dTDP-4-dehydrorhamnose 3,5-epimerase-like enzyme